jgi:hypothetical protein
MTAMLDRDTLPTDRSPQVGGIDTRGWLTPTSARVEFLLAAELTFARAVEQAAEETTDDTPGLVRTATRRMLDAASVIAADDVVPDVVHDDLVSASAGVRELAELAGQVPPGHASLACRMLAVEADLACVVRRLRRLRG